MHRQLGRPKPVRALLALLLTTGVIVNAAACTSGPPALGSGLDLSGYDRGVRAQDDLYRFANGTWLNKTTIPPDRAEFGAFTQLAMKSQADQRTIIDQARGDKSAPPNSDQRKIGDLYNSFMDTAKLDQLGAAPLQPDFAAVDAVTNPAQLVQHLGDLQRIGGSNPVGLSVTQDAKDATHYITDISQGGLSLPDRDYYLNNDARSADIRAKYLGYVAKMLGLAGQPDPAGARGASSTWRPSWPRRSGPRCRTATRCHLQQVRPCRRDQGDTRHRLDQLPLLGRHHHRAEPDHGPAQLLHRAGRPDQFGAARRPGSSTSSGTSSRMTHRT